MEDSEAGAGSIYTYQMNYSNNLKSRVVNVLKTINTKEDIEFRNSVAEAISKCDEGMELSAIFKMYLNDDNICQYIYSRNSLKEELDRIGQYYIEPYESVLNGLPFKDSINFHVYCSPPRDDPKIFNRITQTLKNSYEFSEVLRLSEYPTIKCYHRGTGTRKLLCIDISEPYDLHNSKFINQIKQADNRINELMTFLKIWFFNLKIYTHPFMTKYCLMTMITFYLQNSNPPVLESIKTINFKLNSHIPMNPTQNVHQMIKGFFEFYNSVDFEKVIIAPYLGKLINKADFKNKVFKYPEYEEQLQMLANKSGEPVKELETDYPLCVQDMFFLNRNIASREFDCEYLKKCINMAHKKCCDPKLSTKNLYTSLLVNIIDELEEEFSDTSIYNFKICPRRGERRLLAKIVDEPLNVSKIWTKAYIGAITQIITAVYKIDMILLPPPTENCTFKKLEETEELPLPFKWSISSTVDVWTDRVIPKKNVTFMENQLEQTEKLYAERKDKPEFAVELKGFITITINENFSSLLIKTSGGAKMTHELRKFSLSLQLCMRNYSLKYRIRLLESQLQTNL